MRNATEVSRRSFIAGAAMAGVAATLGLAGCAPQGERNEATAQGSNTKWSEECDVLVVGSGYTGLAAAIEAKSAGADVKVIEKANRAGGNSSLAAGDFAVCNSSVQEREGVQDSIDQYVDDMMVAGLYLNDRDKCRMIAEKSNETWEWTIEMGATWAKNDDGEYFLYPYGGHTVMRSIAQGEGGGANVTGPFVAKLEEMGVEIETKRMLTELVKDDSGRVIGAIVHDKPNGNDAESGTPVAIKANKAVVLASGGFGRDLEFRMAQDPRLDDSVDCTNQEGATAESLRAAVAAGAMAVHTDWIQLLPFMSPDEQGYGVAAFYTDGQASYAPTLNAATGKRIVNELTDRKRYADAILETGQPCVQITCKKALYDNGSGLEDALAAGIATEFSSIEEAAEHYGMPVDAVKAEIDRYNTFVANKTDEDFGKPIPEDAQSIDEAPFYGVRLWPKVHHCMGGVKTDLECRALDMNLKVIPGLYVAGEAAGGIHGACRLGSCATADCLVNGRIAGQNAAKEQAV
ncbi:flavocytochrome c [Gordonibacter sp. An230]|uniref:flavocytochrome c n=1 Tax=Gordonibacter sp. An230 TaxID=1965592 RepID=UPI001EF56506|nr:flavocytochrome c [Gordonibacter sp. An230]